MTRVESSSDTWYIDIDASASFVFTRINGSGNPVDRNAKTADYTGYLPINYSKQGCISTTDGHIPWGTSEDLRTLIDHLHDAGAKVIADIVINHSTAHTDEKD